MEITSFALFGWSMALASILFFYFHLQKGQANNRNGSWFTKQ